MSLFPPRIQQTLRDTAAVRQRMVGVWPQGVRHQCSDHDSIYHGYPFLFVEAFPRLTLEEVAPLARGTGLLFDSIIIADRVMDEETEEVTADLLGVELLQFEGYHLLHSLIPSEANFWLRLREYLVAYSEACLAERRFADSGASWHGFSESVAMSIAIGKCGVAKIAVAGLVALARDDSAFAALTRSIEQYYVARQMLDDLSDWRRDFESGFPSLLLSQVVAAAFAGDRTQMRTQKEQARREIFYGGHAKHTMELALAAITESDRLTIEYPNLLWRQQTASIRDRCVAVLGELEQLGAHRPAVRRKVSIALPPPTDPFQEVAGDAVSRILGRWIGVDLGSAIAAVPKASDPLPLALVADALCEVDGLLGGVLQPLIQVLADYLIQRRRPEGGWCYSTASGGLPFDTDHLGLVLRALIRADRRADLERQGSDSFDRLLESVVFCADGGVETWIPGSTALPRFPAEGPDSAVTSQLLEALALYDSRRFRERIQRGAEWLERGQLADGSWRSGSYRGPYYPTVACLRLLVAQAPDSSSIARAASFLRDARRAEGWGHAGAANDAASTALAVEGLALCQSKCTISAQDFESVPRLLAGLLESEGNGDLTMAFVLRAAVRWQRLYARAGEEVVCA